MGSKKDLGGGYFLMNRITMAKTKEDYNKNENN
jgi:hypothetical protein